MSNQTYDYSDLRVSLTSAYDWVWNDSGSGAHRNVTFWQPKSQGDGDLRPLGSIGIGDYPDINGRTATLLVGANPNELTSGGKPAVASPTRYTRFWLDEGSGAHHNGSIWMPIPPAGYVSLGHVVTSGWWDQPDVNKIWCLRDDLVTDGNFGASSFWDDENSGAKIDVSCWSILPDSVGVSGSEDIPILADTFWATKTYSRPGYSPRVPVLRIRNKFKEFVAKLPEIRPDTIPRTGEQFDYMEQCLVTLPFIAFFPSTDQRSLEHIDNPFCSVGRSIAWHAEGVWVNKAGGSFSRSETTTCGMSTEQTTEMKHSAGIKLSGNKGIELMKYSVSLNYQFTYSNSRTFTEYSEKEVVKTFNVPPYNATVLFSKHIWLNVARAGGSPVLVQIEIAAADDMYFCGCELPKNFIGALEN